MSTGRKNGQDAKWLQQVRRSGTTSDKVAALTLLLHENAVANLRSLDALLAWVLKRKGGRNVVAQVRRLELLSCRGEILPCALSCSCDNSFCIFEASLSCHAVMLTGCTVDSDVVDMHSTALCSHEHCVGTVQGCITGDSRTIAICGMCGKHFCESVTDALHTSVCSTVTANNR